MAGHIPTATSCHWCTEDRIIACNDKVFGKKPDLDPCSNPYSRVGARFDYTLETGHDGLVDPWLCVQGVPIQDIYMNPPFGKGWWKPATEHVAGCFSSHLSLREAACGCERKRDYVWPTDRDAKKERLKAKYSLQGLLGAEQEKAVKKDFDAWSEPYTMVDIGDWVKLAADAGRRCNTIGLLPSYPETQAWFNDVWPRARAIAWPKGRLHFRLVYTLPDGGTIEKTGPAPMSCALPLWTPDDEIVKRFDEVYSSIGKVVIL